MTKKHKAKFDKVMHEFASGTLRSSDGKKVTSRKQALAIAYSEARNVEKAAEGNFYGGPVLAQVGERSSRDKKYEPWEYVFFAPGSGGMAVVAPAKKGEQPTMNNGIRAVLEQVFKAVPAKKMQGGATVTPPRPGATDIYNWWKSTGKPGRPGATDVYAAWKQGLIGPQPATPPPGKPGVNYTPIPKGSALPAPTYRPTSGYPAGGGGRSIAPRQESSAARGLEINQWLLANPGSTMLDYLRSQGYNFGGAPPVATPAATAASTPAATTTTATGAAATLPAEFMNIPFIQQLLAGTRGSALQRMTGTAQPFGPDVAMPNWQGTNYYEYLKRPDYQQKMVESIASAFGMPPEQAIDQMRRATLMSLGSPISGQYIPGMR